MDIKKSCGKLLAPGQWWRFCGETDMGQTLPVLCTECGGDMILADDQDAERKVAEILVIWKKENERLDKDRAVSAWEHPARWKKASIEDATQKSISDHEEKTGWKPDFVVIKLLPTQIDQTEDVLRKSINPFDLGLDEERTKVLENMLRNAATEISGWND